MKGRIPTPGGLGLAVAAGALLAWGAIDDHAADAATLTVYKSPSCGCCGAWVEHVRAAGFATEVQDRGGEALAAVKARHGIHVGLASCHTAVVAGYAVEGHVPADLVQRLLRERPAVAGLTVPGMPPRAPGMDAPTGPAYDVLAFGGDGSTELYARR